MTTAVCWDIDGTLLTTARAGVLALEDAAEEICGTRPALGSLKTAGLTDGEIAHSVICSCGGDPTNGHVEAFLRGYERRLPTRLPFRRGHVLPGVEDVLLHLERRPDVVCLLLTGNTRAGAAAKLAHYGLEGRFEGGAFCRGAESRESIAAHLRTLVTEHLQGPAPPERFYVVGDTPADIRCGKAVGARTVAVASGEYTLEQLEAAGPWRALPRLPDPEAFASLLDLDA